jgi:hypothetical protein
MRGSVSEAAEGGKNAHPLQLVRTHDSELVAEVMVVELPKVCGNPADKERCHKVTPAKLIVHTAIGVADLVAGEENRNSWAKS